METLEGLMIFSFYFQTMIHGSEKERDDGVCASTLYEKLKKLEVEKILELG